MNLTPQSYFSVSLPTNLLCFSQNLLFSSYSPPRIFSPPFQSQVTPAINLIHRLHESYKSVQYITLFNTLLTSLAKSLEQTSK